MIILSGLSFSDKKGDRKEQLQDFFSNTMSLDVCVEDSYMLGKLAPRPIVITLNTYSEKRQIMEKKAVLRHYEGEKGCNIYINDYIPAHENERRKRERDIIKTAKETGTAHEYTSQGLKIGNELYKKKVSAPDPCELIDMEMQDINRILELEMDKGRQVMVKDSTFRAYGADVKTHAEVRDFYMKVKLMYARARHIVCAYYIPG